jgi:hypothetical protein
VRAEPAVFVGDDSRLAERGYLRKRAVFLRDIYEVVFKVIIELIRILLERRFAGEVVEPVEERGVDLVVFKTRLIAFDE